MISCGGFRDSLWGSEEIRSCNFQNLIRVQKHQHQQQQTRRHCSRMRTAHMPTVYASVTSHQMSVLRIGVLKSWCHHRCYKQRRVGSTQVNKFEQAYSLDQQMSPVVGPIYRAGAGGVSVQKERPGLGGGRSVLRSNASWVMVTRDPPVDR